MEFKDNVNSEYKTILNRTKEEKRLGMHSFHRYYGKLIPAIPRAFIREFTLPGELVFDPFSGSGTTALESKFLDRNFLGVEINPLSVMMSEVKTENYDIKTLELIYDSLIQKFENDNFDVSDNEIPFCINRDHWFKQFVQIDLVKISRNINVAVEECTTDTVKYVKFFNSILSAVVKQVSNADTMHVFPGISKRMRRLEKEGLIKINVFETYKRACKKRITYVKELLGHNLIPNIINGDTSSYDFSPFYNTVDLIVTNPPYISSVRYAETLKLELYWMGIINSSEEYTRLANSMIGNDHIAKKDTLEKKHTGYEPIDLLIDQMFEIDKKQAKVIYDFFTSMEKVIKNMVLLLKQGKKLVMKISDSKIRKIKVPTGALLTYIAEKNGFKLIDVFNDKISQNSRSLLTARNTYSDIILEDNIIFWEKI